MSFSSYFSVIRPFNCLMAAAAVYIGYAVSLSALAFSQAAFLAMAAAFLVCAGGQTINDCFDRQVDRKKNPSKPIPSGRIAPESALAYSLALFIAGNVLAFFVNQTALLIAVAFTLLLIFYSAFLHRYKYIGNWVVAAGTAFTLIFGASVVGVYGVVLFFAFSALLANVARELIKDVQDLEADKGFKLSLPMKLSLGKIKGLTLSLYLAAVAAAFYVYISGMVLSTAYAAALTVASAVMLYSFTLFYKNSFEKAHRQAKLGMLLALAAFLSSVLGWG